MDKTKTPVYLCKSWYDGESDTVRDCTCGTCEKAIKKVKPTSKQQFIEKSMKVVEKVIDNAYDSEMETLNEKMILNIVQSKLSECWDMAGMEKEKNIENDKQCLIFSKVEKV